MLRGQRVVLRPVKRADISLFLKWFNDPEVTQYLTMYLPMTEMAEEKWIDFNERSLRMHRKLGFREEGRLRKIDFKNGEYHDRVMFGLLREEWLPG